MASMPTCRIASMQRRWSRLTNTPPKSKMMLRISILCLCFLHSGDATYEFSYPQHGRCAHEDDEPFLPAERLGAEHVTAKSDNKPLSYQDEEQDEHQALVGQEAMEGCILAGVGLGIEEVPELQHHERGEEPCQLVSVYAALTIALAIEQEDEHGREEDKATPQDGFAHAWSDDEVTLLAGLVFHHFS